MARQEAMKYSDLLATKTVPVDSIATVFDICQAASWEIEIVFVVSLVRMMALQRSRKRLNVGAQRVYPPSQESRPAVEPARDVLDDLYSTEQCDGMECMYERTIGALVCLPCCTAGLIMAA